MPSFSEHTPDESPESAPDERSESAPASAPARRVSVEPGGPVLIEGPVEALREDGTPVRSDRFVVALCTCRRSRTYPWCDTSHRRRARPAPPPDERNAR